MDNKIIHKLLMSGDQGDVILGYEYFSNKFKDIILEHPSEPNGYYISQEKVEELLEVPVFFSMSWRKDYFKNEL